ncbi:MAG: type III restriction endonuclease subunit R [Planctomycetota bacterium]|nr:MAG: type III restriction endonuclease subunit R [Planctomycetota bacterium]REK18314.1 MAG: type III restriction endonuclease subunit R [Planctomycetota bacterium]REK49183.1 MAG: type III restriction endonuclease subunit R [Planctomycetota bacterium]
MPKQDTTINTLTVPALWAHPVRTSIGQIVHLLKPERTLEVLDVEEAKVSPRRTESLYVVSTGERLVMTERRTCPLPVGADGILIQADNGAIDWLHSAERDAHRDKTKGSGLADLKREIAITWRASFRYRAEQQGGDGVPIEPGLRPPQIGALHAIGSHWSLYRHPATIVMPTGTGKTETMLSALAAFGVGTMLVVVPTRPLKDQTIRKFTTFGLLRDLGVLPDDVENPIVGIISKRPRKKSDLRPYAACHVVVATMSSLAQGTAAGLLDDLALLVDTLVVDEAHHIAAKTWRGFREAFQSRRVLQFTATPFRRDGELVDGDVIYSYPLRRAQTDGYFKPITFSAVHEIDPEDADQAIAERAIGHLKDDLTAGWDHLLMARCDTIERATSTHGIYESLAPEYEPILVHSESAESVQNLDKLRSGKSKIVVCVDMLGEGFDLPQLKIAAVHDTHKSLSVLLQFTGRFTRTSGKSVGDATVVANIADLRVSDALERLYSEDADWNHLLSEFSSQAVKEHKELIDFLNASERLDDGDLQSTRISHHLLRPKFSAVVYHCNAFKPKKFHEALGKEVTVHAVWLHHDSNTLYFVTRSDPPVLWTRSKEVHDRQWHLYVVHFDSVRKLLFVNSTDKSSVHEGLANAVGEGVKIIQGDTVFRTLGNINRLIFQNIGVRKVGRRNLRYAKYTGADVRQALSITQTSGSVKSDLAGTGFELGGPVTIGCSIKGRIWSRRNDTVRRFLDWCQGVGGKLIDASIDTSKIIENVLIPDEVTAFPDAMVLCIDWPLEILRQSEEKVTLSVDDAEFPITLFEIEADDTSAQGDTLRFRVASENHSCQLSLRLGVQRGFEVAHVSGSRFKLKCGKLETNLETYLSDYPPLIKFSDMSELDGNLLVRPQDTRELVLPPERFEPWDWSGVDIAAESIWKSDKRRSSSIQGHVAEKYQAGGFTVVFDDDAKGEAADLICLKEEDEVIRLALVHCKFSKGKDAGERVGDVVEVCSQAVRSAKWKWRFRELVRHVLLREKRLRKSYRSSRFLKGDVKELNRFVQLSRFKNLEVEILIAQPGLSRDDCTAEQTAVLAAADSFLLETVGVTLGIVCSE